MGGRKEKEDQQDQPMGPAGFAAHANMFHCLGLTGERSWDLFAVSVMSMKPLCPVARAC